MLVNEAKDLIVNEIARQADLDGGSLSDLERRMLYFTESGDCPEDVFKLNKNLKPNTTQRNTRRRSRV